MPKIVKIGGIESPWHRGEISCSKVFNFFLVSDFLPSSGEHIFGSIAIVFAPKNVFQQGLISQWSRILKIQISPHRPPKHFLERDA